MLLQNQEVNLVAMVPTNSAANLSLKTLNQAVGKGVEGEVGQAMASLILGFQNSGSCTDMPYRTNPASGVESAST